MLLALIVMVIWGFNFAVAKFGLREFSPMFLMCLRFVGVAVVLLPFVRVPWGQMKEIFILSVLLGSLHFPLMFTGLTGVDAATASIAIQLQVPFSSILAAVLYRDKLGWKRGLGMAISFGGVIVIAGEPRALDNTFYLGLVIVAALVFSIVNIQIKRIGNINGFTLNGWMAVMAAPQLLVATLVMETGQWEQLRYRHMAGLEQHRLYGRDGDDRVLPHVVPAGAQIPGQPDDALDPAGAGLRRAVRHRRAG